MRIEPRSRIPIVNAVLISSSLGDLCEFFASLCGEELLTAKIRSLRAKSKYDAALWATAPPYSPLDASNHPFGAKA
jgi:hypothetical protein